MPLFALILILPELPGTGVRKPHLEALPCISPFTTAECCSLSCWCGASLEYHLYWYHIVIQTQVNVTAIIQILLL